MSWIKKIAVEDATGLLKEGFDTLIEQTGYVPNIIHTMSQNPPAMQANMYQYNVLMHQSSPLTRQQREMLATVVSAELDCSY